MDISALNSPPYEYHKTSYASLFLEDDHHHSAFRRVSHPSMPSPPELLMDTSEDEEESVSHIEKKKSVPHKSPSMDEEDNGIIFQLDNHSTPTVIGGGLLWAIRQRVSMARSIKKNNNRRFLPIKKRTLKPLKVYLPKPQWSNTVYQEVEEDQDWYPTPRQQQQHQPQQQQQPVLLLPTTAPTTPPAHVEKKTYKRKTHANSGRPTRVKGPCQACQETSDGCMRKAFNWPFQTSAIYNDKGKPFVYLCNKCGLRYNKSGGCVCRHCRWVLCKEEKRKAMQLIEQMRLSRPDGKVDLDEDIENFACTPKYWNCGRPWKVGWILNSQHDIEDDDEHSF